MIGMRGMENRPVGVIPAMKNIRKGFAEHTKM
jgi:hypothetical protein